MQRFKSVWMDKLDLPRLFVYLEINGYEVEIDVNLIVEVNGKLRGVGLYTEGPDVGEEFLISHNVCEIALERYKEMLEEED